MVPCSNCMALSYDRNDGSSRRIGDFFDRMDDSLRHMGDFSRHHGIV